MRNLLHKPPPAARRWLLRIAIAGAILALIGLSSQTPVMPLMCKIYG
ncbi:hypothetical protein [Sulfuricystis multivorans]|nr:hypothetical protein [Sulfuricystis multivorans]